MHYYDQNTQDNEFEWVQTRLNFVDAMEVGFSNYANFSGRASRSSFWWWMIGIALIMLISMRLSHLDFLKYAPIVVGGALLSPTLAFFFRRIHDSNRSAWWLLLLFVPVVGWLWLLILFLLPSTHGFNDYGNQPNLIRTDML